MKFDYCKDLSADNGYFPVHHFRYTLVEDDVRKVIHKYAYPPNWMTRVFEDHYVNIPEDHPNKIGASLKILQDALCDENVDLGTNYKEKYEELVELLKPYKIDDDMSPATTLKMILKYHK